MPKFFIAFLFICSVHFCSAQKWLWAKGYVNADTSTASVPWAITTDTAGNVIVAGGYRGVTTIGTYTLNSTFTSPWAAFLIAKYNSAGNVLWAQTSVTTPPNSWCFAYSVAADKAGNSYATGLFFGSMSFGAYTINSVQGNVFLVKYDANGNAQWVRTATLVGSSSSAQGNCVAVDATDNPYITGVFNDTAMFGTTVLTNGSSGNAFIVKYDANGNVLWATSPTTTIGCSACLVVGTGLAADKTGNMYAAGNYETPSSVTFGTYALANGNTRNMYITKYDANGNVLWATNATLPSSYCSVSPTADLGEQLTTDALGNVTVTGNYRDTVIIGTQLLTNGFNNSGLPVDCNVFVAKYSATGNPMWAKTATLPNNNCFAVNYGITTDKWDNMYLSGVFYGGFTFGGIQLTGALTGQPAFIIKLDSVGEALCGTLLNNQYESSINVQVTGYNGVAADPHGPNVFFAGGVSGYSQCIFSKDTISGIGDSYGFAAKWTCGTCNVPPLITGAVPICSGQHITLVASGGVNYLWSNNATTDSTLINPASSQKYYVAISNDSCTVNDSVDITVHPTPTPTISNNQTICQGNTANLSASGGSFYNWQPNTGLTSTTIANPVASPSVTTTYTVAISNGYCTVTDTTTVIVDPLPAPTLTNDTTIQPGQSIQLTATGGGTYLWQPTNELSCDTCPNPIASPLVNITYTLTVANSAGCFVNKTVTVDVDCGNVFIPQAFSPNNDGHNDVLYVRGDCIETLQFEIFDRWGNKVFETADRSIGWNGEHDGKPMNTGTYTYYITGTTYNGTTIAKKGNVELVR